MLKRFIKYVSQNMLGMLGMSFYISIFQDKSFNAGECCVGVYHACNHAGDMLPYKQDKVSGADKVGE